MGLEKSCTKYLTKKKKGRGGEVRENTAKENVHRLNVIIKYSECVHLIFLHHYFILSHPGQLLSTNQSLYSLSRDQGQQQSLNDFNLQPSRGQIIGTRSKSVFHRAIQHTAHDKAWLEQKTVKLAKARHNYKQRGNTRLMNFSVQSKIKLMLLLALWSHHVIT